MAARRIASALVPCQLGAWVGLQLAGWDGSPLLEGARVGLVSVTGAWFDGR